VRHTLFETPSRLSPIRNKGERHIADLKNAQTDKTEKRSWWVVEFDVNSRQEDMVSWLMIQLGANGCQFISGEKGTVTLQASFEHDRISPDNLHPIYEALDEYGLGEVAASLRINKLEEQDWLLEWKKGMQPLKLGERFLVSPPWFKDKIPQEDLQGRHIIWIEPGMAFGTGFHTTTQFCLKAIEKHLHEKQNLLDVGSGSGILAIAAAHLLPEIKITAVEIDPVACKVAEENLELNGVVQRIEFLEGSTELVSGKQFDAILSNLTCEDNTALLPEYQLLLSVGGKLIMSGILLEKSALLEDALKKYPLKVIDRVPEGMWLGLVVEREAG
jgi:ribosomal protein L11 methyltransferase